jgi:DNA-binding LacI/PurR family transcriptional regulator
MTTIEDVAREAGVSVATVSRVLNNQGVVRSETAQKVYSAIEKLHYQPNLLARNFRRSETRVLVILTPNITNPYYSHILSGIGDTATQRGYSALICNTADDHDRELKALNMLRGRRADGAVLMASSMGCDWLLPYAEEFPLVQCSEFDPAVRIPHVAINNYAATKEVLEYLIRLGHRKIAHITADNRYYSTQRRLDGYRETLAENTITVPAEYVGIAARDYSFHSGKKAAKQILSLPDRPTAIFCISDTLALGAITAAKEMGLEVPRDLTVFGFDDVDETQMFHPYLSTVAQPCYELGCRSVELLLDQIQNPEKKVDAVTLDYEMVLRESSSALGAGSKE